ncbi:hypothetical protein [Erwinia persicina]
MYRNKRELLADIMLGEAVLKLLLDGDAISSSALIQALAGMAASEKDSQRQRACLRAISNTCSSQREMADVADGLADSVSGGPSTLMAGKHQTPDWRSGSLSSSDKWH